MRACVESTNSGGSLTEASRPPSGSDDGDVNFGEGIFVNGVNERRENRNLNLNLKQILDK